MFRTLRLDGSNGYHGVVSLTYSSYFKLKYSTNYILFSLAIMYCGCFMNVRKKVFTWRFVSHAVSSFRAFLKAPP